jgi:membrane associated rhomboid family serine protease
MFNMYFLYVLGSLLEPAIGRVRFAAIYFTSLFAGSFGALLISPLTLTVGASGAVFGLMGAALIEMRSRGIDPWRSGLGMVVALNLLITFIFPNISIGGHLGGLIGGLAAGLVADFGDRRRWPTALTVSCILLLGAAAVAGSIAAAGTAGV